jgi:signal transduction histidine kinase
LSQYAREYFQNTTVECDLRLQGDLPHRDLSAEFRHNVFLAFEESLSNVLKHSGATRVDVQIQFEEGTLTIRIKDNGFGFAAAAHNGEGDRNGLKNMKQHLEDVGGTCVVQSRPGQGAGVELKVTLETESKEAI